MQRHPIAKVSLSMPHQPIIQPLITPTRRSASGQGKRPRRKPRVPYAPKIKHDKMETILHG